MSGRRPATCRWCSGAQIDRDAPPRLLAADGAVLTLADRAPGRAEALASELGAAVSDPDTALDLECDVLAPCALGPVIEPRTRPRLKCRAVCGAANNQLAGLDVDDTLAARGVLYAPDFVVNAGGIINLAEERERRLLGRSAPSQGRSRSRRRPTPCSGAPTPMVCRPAAPPSPLLAAHRREGKGYWRPEDSNSWRASTPLIDRRAYSPDDRSNGNVARR